MTTRKSDRSLVRLPAPLKRTLDAVAGLATVSLLKPLRRADPDRIANGFGKLFQRIGPWTPEHRVGRANLTAAYPEKSAAEIEHILLGVWDNLGRVVAEYAHLDRLWDYDLNRVAPGRVEASAETHQRFLEMRDDAKPALVFGAHLANWELPALAAAAHGLEMALIYRAPNLSEAARAVRRIRAINMGTLIPTGIAAPAAAATALERGVHVGMLIDQHFTRGVEVEFFGRRCMANPLLARLARHYDCPIHGTRMIRLPEHRFRIEVTEAIPPVRNATGDIDVQATMQSITSLVEGWVREYPEQWLWLHRRWR